MSELASANFCLRLATWNVRNIPAKCEKEHIEGIFTELGIHDIDIACLQETKLKQEDAIDYNHELYSFYWIGSNYTRRIHGTGVVVKREHVTNIEITTLTPRIIQCKLKTKGVYVNIFNVYGLQRNSDVKDKEAFYDILDDRLSKVPTSEYIFLLGDFNAHVGAKYDKWPGCLGEFGVGECNENGTLLLKLCLKFGICVTNTYFNVEETSKMTCLKGKNQTQIDFIITRYRDINCVMKTKSLNYCNKSDHKMVISKVKIPYTNIQLRKELILYLLCSYHYTDTLSLSTNSLDNDNIISTTKSHQFFNQLVEIKKNVNKIVSDLKAAYKKDLKQRNETDSQMVSNLQQTIMESVLQCLKTLCPKDEYYTEETKKIEDTLLARLLKQYENSQHIDFGKLEIDVIPNEKCSWFDTVCEWVTFQEVNGVLLWFKNGYILREIFYARFFSKNANFNEKEHKMFSDFTIFLQNKASGVHNILLSKIREVLFSYKEQFTTSYHGIFAFSSKESMMFSLRQLLDEYTDKPLYIAYLDLSSVFDMINGDLLLNMMLNLGCRVEFVRYISHFIENTRCSICLNKDGFFKLTDIYDRHNTAAPVVMDIFFNYVMSLAFNGNKHIKIEIDTKDMTTTALNGYCFGDSLLLFASSKENIQKCIAGVVDTFETFHLNIEKVEVMLNKHGYEMHTLSETEECNMKKIDINDHLLIEDTVIAEDCSHQIKKNLDKAAKKWIKWEEKILSEKFNLIQAVCLYEEKIIKCLLHGRELWSLTPEQAAAKRIMEFHEDHINKLKSIKRVQFDPKDFKVKLNYLRILDHTKLTFPSEIKLWLECRLPLIIFKYCSLYQLEHLIFRQY